MRRFRFSLYGLMLVGTFLLFLPPAGAEESVILKYKGQVLEETDDYVIIKFPKANIELIHNQTRKSRERDATPKGGTVSGKTIYLEPKALNQLKSELKKELKAEFQQEVKKEVNKKFRKGDVGSVEGRILHRGVGLASCRVKLVRVPQASSFQGIFKELKKGDEFETVTDKDGRYAFRDIPTGKYQMQWLPRGWDSWVRRLTEKPDITVRKGKTFHAKDVDMKRKVIEG